MGPHAPIRQRSGAADCGQQVGAGNVAHCQCSASSRCLSGTEEPGCGVRSDHHAIDGCHPDTRSREIEADMAAQTWMTCDEVRVPGILIGVAWMGDVP